MGKKKIVIYDSMNGLVWVDGQKRVKGGKGDTKYYGKDAKRFSSNTQTRSYAIKLAKKYNGKVYDKYYSKYLQKKRKSRRSSSLYGSGLFSRIPGY